MQELKEALDADIQDRIMKEREMQSYIEEREREVAEREAAWKAELSRREVSIIQFYLFSKPEFLWLSRFIEIGYLDLFDTLNCHLNIKPLSSGRTFFLVKEFQ